MFCGKTSFGSNSIIPRSYISFFINYHYFSFVDKCREAGITVPIIPGIKPIRRRKDIEFLPQTFHIDLPSDLVNDVAKAENLTEIKDIGVEFCKDQVRELIKGIVLRVDAQKMEVGEIQKFRDLCEANRGTCKLYFDITSPDLPGGTQRIHSRKYVVEPTPDLMKGITKIFGKDNVVLESDAMAWLSSQDNTF